jgi:cytochrome c oxidase assembly factor CtaG
VAVLGLILWIAGLVPPLSTWAGRYQFAQAIQFSLFAFAAPALLVSGAQWTRLGLASREPARLDSNGRRASSERSRWLDRLALTRTTASHQQRAVRFAMMFAALTIFWRVAPVVDYLVKHPWLTVVESVSLTAMGVVLFADVIESPPLMPGASRPYRIGIAAGVMWISWIVAYLNGMSHASWYQAFQHVAGQGVSLSADQQLSAASVWLISGAVFVPTIFWNLMHWLQSGEDPNEELGRLIRDERSRRFFGTD